MATRPCAFYSIFLLAFLSLAFQLTGDIYPGWLRVRKDMKEINEQMLVLPTAGLKEVDVIIGEHSESQDDQDTPVAMAQRRGGDTSSSEEDEEADGQWFVEFLTDTAEGDLTVIVEHIEEYEVSVDVGFFFSRLCIHRVPVEPKAEPRKESHKHKCNCRAVSTKVILSQFSFMFKPMKQIALEMIQDVPRDEHKGTFLPIMKCMPLIAVGFTFIGLIFGTLGFRKENGCKCFRAACMMSMLFAVPLIVVPVTRAAIENYHLHSTGTRIMCPISVIVAGNGALLAAICFLVALAGLCKSGKMQASGQWYKFNNELATGKKPSLVFLDDALPEKVDLGFTPTVSETDPAPQENCALEKQLIK